ncbi:PepSY domain-containing protein [Hoeflea sp. AS16]|uniref:PepSY domain-containing protein n=1 Tax=Hoeflea sp. AS16 TaxID=3135779 RepID=UPI00317825C3
MKSPLIAAALFSVLAPAAALASQDCPNVPRDQWMSDAAIMEKAKSLGYDVRSIKVDDGCAEAYALDKGGKRVEVYFHPGTGDVVKVKADD